MSYKGIVCFVVDGLMAFVLILQDHKVKGFWEVATGN